MPMTTDKTTRNSDLSLSLADADANANQHFPHTEMKLITAAIYTNYRTSILDDEGIEQEDAYTAHPKGNKLVLRYERVEK